jgi:hypothetical protein
MRPVRRISGPRRSDQDRIDDRALYSYDPFGVPRLTGAGSSWPFLYQGMEHEITDPAPLYFDQGANVYNPMLQRELSQLGQQGIAGPPTAGARRRHGEQLRRFRPQPELRESRRTQRRPDRLQPPHRRPGAVPVRTGRDRHRGGGSPADSRPGRSSEWCLRFVRWRRRSRDTKTVGAPQTPDVPLAGNLSGTDSSANIFRGRWPVSSDRDARAAACRVR